MKKRSADRNGIIDLLKFIFSIIVVMLHTHGLRPPSRTDYPFAGGYTAVEFFLIVGGFFAAKYSFQSAGSTPAQSACMYTAKQFKKLFPVVCVSVVIHYAVVCCMGGLDIQDIPYIVYEVLLLPQSGIYKTFLNLPLWYLSAYMICMPVFLYLIKKSKDFFVNIGTMIIPLIIYGFICRVNVDIDIWSFESGIMFIGLFRVFAGLCMGLCCYRISKVVDAVPWTRNESEVCLAVALIMILGIIGYQAIFAYTYADYFLILLMTISLAMILGCKHTYSPNNKLFDFLGKWSVSIYSCHWLIRTIIPILFPAKDYYGLLPLYILAVLIYAIFVIFLASGAQKLARAVTRRVVSYDSKI